MITVPTVLLEILTRLWIARAGYSSVERRQMRCSLWAESGDWCMVRCNAPINNKY